MELRAQARLELDKRQGLKDLYFFNNVILGYHEMFEPVHKLMCESVEQGGSKQLHLWPRGHFKSSMITIGYVLQRIANDPNIRILIANVVAPKSEAFLREIKGHMEKNVRFRTLYGEHVPKNDKWNDKEIISAQRTKNLKEPTILAVGAGQSVTGFHFDLILGDDLIDYDTVNTPEQMAKTKRWWGDAQSLLEPGGQTILIGTRYHYGDLYGEIIDNMTDEYHPQIHSAYNPDGTVLFSSRFTPEMLASIRKEQGSYMFSCQYLNQPVDDESAKFKKSNIVYFEDKDIFGKQFYTTMTVDRAYSLNKTADFTGITIRSVDLDNRWYVRYAERIKAHEGEIIDKIFDLKKHFRVDKVGVEQKAFKDTLEPVLKDEMRRRNEFFTVVELVGKNSKVARIESLVPRFEARSVFIMNTMSDLEDELLRFPSAPHDDLADSLAYHNDPKMYGAPQQRTNLQVQNYIKMAQNTDYFDQYSG